MAGYNELRGLRVKYLSADPANPEDGQVWYNSTTGNLRVQGIGVAAWSSAAPMISAKKAAMPGGIQTAAFTAGGNDGPANVNSTFEYNGSGFSTGGNINTTRRGGGGAGTLTAGLILGGFTTAVSNATEEYDGSSWTAGGSLGTSRSGMGSNGLQTAAFAIGGYNGTTQTNITEEYDGTSWTSGNTSPTSAGERAADGIQTAAIVFGGINPGSTRIATAEEYDGTNFTTAASLNTARERLSGFGTQSNAYAFGGEVPPSTAKTENYNGTSWTETSDMATARKENQSGQTGSPTAGIAMGGNTAPGSAISATEEFNFSSTTITPAAWSAGGNLSTARQRTGGFGDSQTSAVVAAGATAPPASALSATEEYNGSAWTSSGNVNTARFNMTAFGTEPAGVLSGIGTPSVSYGGTTEEYNGSTWTTVNPYAAPGANYRSSCGPQTAGLLSGGVSPAPAEHTNAVEEYDGTNWTSGTNLPQYQAYNNQAGTQTAAINGGGNSGPNATTVNTNAISLEYDGSTWTAGPNANLFADKLTGFNGGIGTQTAAIFSGGAGTGTVRYDGTTFATDASIAAARGDVSAAGLAPASAGIVFCGSPVPGVGNTVDEYSAETITTNPANNLSVS